MRHLKLIHSQREIPRYNGTEKPRGAVLNELELDTWLELDKIFNIDAGELETSNVIPFPYLKALNKFYGV